MKKRLSSGVEKIKRLKNRGESVPSAVPRITNQTIAEHREEVLKGARKYIYPLQHSKHRILLLTTSILIVGVIAFFSYVILALYRFHGSSTFLYGVTQVIPFPVAKTGGQYVSYENYLFEVRHYTHYYQNQQLLDFDTPEGSQQLDAFRKQALEKVVNDAYIKQLARKYNVQVTDAEVDEQIQVVRNQNRLGSSDDVFEDVLQSYWGWSIDDFRRSLKTQLLTQKVVAVVDTETNQRAQAALAEIESGEKFADVAKKYSDDSASRENGGNIGVVDRSNRDITGKTVEVLYGLREGEVSEVINIGYNLEIIKNLKNTPDGKREAAHILFNFRDISHYLTDIKEQEQTRLFISVE